MSLEPVIGLEIHVQLKTHSKMFCSCENLLEESEPNTAICPICLGYPGTLPVPNAEAIRLIQVAGSALNCELATKTKFDRKHYYYPDLPKGYQISQFDQPFCKGGYLDITVAGTVRRLRLERIHLEEDAAKNTHTSSGTLIDYNRGGTPLMEIVTQPDFTSSEEAKIFLQELQKIMRTLDISPADMEKGHLRCDANVSLRPVGDKSLHPKTEVKNINSFKFVAKALDYEIQRQTQLWEAGTPPSVTSTRGFDSKTNTTSEQRTKEAAADYRYFPEPDIPPFEFNPTDLAQIKSRLPELPLAKKTRLIKQTKISEQSASLLTDQPPLADFFEAVASEIDEIDNEQVAVTSAEVPKLNQLAANLILRQLRDLDGSQVSPNITPENFAELCLLVYKSKINQDAVSQVLAEMQKTGGDPDPIIDRLGLAQVSDQNELTDHVQAVIDNNPDVVSKIQAGKDGALQFLMGQVMARTQGRANPQEVINLLKSKLQ